MILTGKEAEKLVRSIQDRRNTAQHRAGRGIGLASSYLAGLKGVTPEAVKAAESKLVYRDEGMDVVGGISMGRKFGSSMDEQVMTGTPLAILDFEGIVTTARKDRDGDRLAPQGAELDRSMPLLWQHLPEQPVGRMVKLLKQDELEVRSHLAIADIPLGRDAATLVEFGALRLSHGFQPLEFEPANEKDADAGWLVHKYAVMETSLVSVPSNVDSVITAFSRQKLHTPIVKGWAQDLYDARPQQVTSGWQGQPVVNVNVTIDNVKTPAVKSTPTKGRRIKAEEDEIAADALPELPGLGADPAAGETTPGVPTEPEEPEAPKDVLLTDIRELVDEAAKSGDLPKEAKARLKVLSEMIGDVEDKVKAAAKAIGGHSSDQNLAGMYSEMEAMNAAVVEVLARVSEESVRIQGLEGAEGVADTLAQLDAQIVVLIDALTMLSDSSDPQEIEEAGDDGALDPQGADVADGDVDPLAGSGLPTMPALDPAMRSRRPRRKGGAAKRVADVEPMTPDMSPDLSRFDYHDVLDRGEDADKTTVVLDVYDNDTGDYLGEITVYPWFLDNINEDEDGVTRANEHLSAEAMRRLGVGADTPIWIETKPADGVQPPRRRPALNDEYGGGRDRLPSRPGIHPFAGSARERSARSVSVDVSDARGNRVGTFRIDRQALKDNAAAIETGTPVLAGDLLTEKQARGLSLRPGDRVTAVISEADLDALFTKDSGLVIYSSTGRYNVYRTSDIKYIKPIALTDAQVDSARSLYAGNQGLAASSFLNADQIKELGLSGDDMVWVHYEKGGSILFDESGKTEIAGNKPAAGSDYGSNVAGRPNDSGVEIRRYEDLWYREPAVQPTQYGGGTEADVEAAPEAKMVGVTCADCQKEFYVPKRQSGLNAVCPWCDNAGQRPEGEMGKDWIIGERDNGGASRDDGVIEAQKNDASTEDLEPELEADDDHLPEFAGEMAAKEVGGSTRTCSSCGATWQEAAGTDGECPTCGVPSATNSGTVKPAGTTAPTAPSAPTAPAMRSARPSDATSELLARKLLGALFVGKSVSLPTLVALQEAVESAIDEGADAVLANV